jgi:hypothetical protein
MHGYSLHRYLPTIESYGRRCIFFKNQSLLLAHSKLREPVSLDETDDVGAFWQQATHRTVDHLTNHNKAE